MALLLAYTLHDVKAVTYSPPFFCANDAIAKRMLLDLVSDQNTMPGRHPSDFKLYKIGTFDEGNAAIMPLPVPEHVVDAVALAPKRQDYFTSAMPFTGPLGTPSREEFDRLINGTQRKE